MKSTARERKAMAKRFYRLRRKLHLSQEAFAALIGRKRVAIANIELAKKYPQYETLRRFEVFESTHDAPNSAR